VAGEPTSVPRATTPQVRQAVDRAITYLQTESAAWLNTRKCAACHHVPMPLWALGEAERHGYAVDKEFLAETAESLLGSEDNLMASKVFPNPADPPDPRPQGRGLNMGLPFLAVAARSLPKLEKGQEQSLELIAEEIVKKQQPDGSWEFFATLRRPPINESQLTDAAWIIMALQEESGPDAPGSRREALARAIAWLDAAKPFGLHQEKALKLLLAIRSGTLRERMQAAIDELLALQRDDGGWSQTVPDLRSDAFATGQTLYVLSLAGYTAERPEIRRGIDFLVATQEPDGSWPMISRSTPDGSPGGAKLLTPIICAASSWATLGLARLVPGGSPVSNAGAARDIPKVPTEVAGTYKGGELVELRVRGRLAYLIKPTGKIDPHKRWVWDFPFWLAINDGFGEVAHRYYVERLLAAGFHVAGVDVGPSCGSPAAADVCQEFYEQLVSEHGLHKRARALAHSHGGLIAYGWTGSRGCARRPTSARIRPCPTSSPARRRGWITACHSGNSTGAPESSTRSTTLHRSRRPGSKSSTSTAMRMSWCRPAPTRRSLPAATVNSVAKRRSSSSRAWAPSAPIPEVMTGRSCTSRLRC
jgi:hypothetical protein